MYNLADFIIVLNGTGVYTNVWTLQEIQKISQIQALQKVVTVGYRRRRYRSARPRDPWESNHGIRYDRNPYRGMRYVAPYVGFKFMTEVDNWRLRGKYYDDYYKNTGKRPTYYNKLTRKRIKW